MSRLKLHRLILILALMLMTLTLATCITAEEHDTITYDPAKDEFQFLMVMQDIHVKDADDLAYLQALYNNRDHLIAPAIPGNANIISQFDMSLLRLSDNQFLVLNIYGQRPSAIEPVTTPVPLNDVQIHPGTFFVQNGKVGYYQSLTVPGKVIDAALVETSKVLQSEDTLKSVQDEIDRRAAGGKTVTWDQVKTAALANMIIDAPASEPATTASAPASEPADIQPFYALDADSLKSLKRAITDKSLRITRDKQTFSTTLPVSAHDAAAIADLIKAMIARGEQLVAATKQTPDIAEKLEEARAVLKIASVLNISAGDKGISATVDYLKLNAAVDSLATKPVNNNDAKDELKGGPDVLKFLADQKIDVSNTITPEQIKADFLAGKLKAYPSPNPLKPGDGMVAPKTDDNKPAGPGVG